MPNRGENYFPELMERVKRACPDLDEGAARYACNKITNELRRAPYDVYQVGVRGVPFDPAPGYFTHFTVEASGKTIYVRVAVD